MLPRLGRPFLEHLVAQNTAEKKQCDQMGALLPRSRKVSANLVTPRIEKGQTIQGRAKHVAHGVPNNIGPVILRVHAASIGKTLATLPTTPEQDTKSSSSM